MPTLLEVQRAVSAFLTQGDQGVAVFVAADGLAPSARLDIYRNTYTGNLAGAVQIAYPAVRRLVGEEFFEGTARAFIDACPPRSAYLNEYGAELGVFLAGFEPASSLAYLPDVARLEWAVNAALHAEDAPVLNPAALTDLPNGAEVSFVAHPSVSLLEVKSPADTIWRATLNEDDASLTDIDLDAGPFHLLVSRGRQGVSVARLEAGEFLFSEAVLSGIPLSHALAAAGGDMSSVLAAHLAEGRFTGFRLEHQNLTGGTS